MKKRILYLILIVTVFFSCKKENIIDYAIIKGNISGIDGDSVTIYNYYYDVIKTIPLKKNKSFLDTINITEQYYFFTIGEIRTLLYLRPTYNLSIDIVAIEGKTNITYSGVGANENKYLLEKNEYTDKLPKIVPSLSNYISFQEKEFVNIVESNYAKQINFLNKYHNLEEDFIFIESKSIEYEKLGKLSFYEGNMRYLTGNDLFKVSSNFPDYYRNIDLSNEKLKFEPNYMGFINAYIRKLALKKSKNNDSFDKTITMLEVADSIIKNQQLKDELCYRIGRHLENSNNIDVAFQKFNTIVKNENHKQIIKKKYLRAKKISTGDVSPTFELYDINNNKVALTDYIGNYVYIDIWNTYCKPCLIEMPKFENLKKKYKNKNIQFISICVNSNIESWKSIVKNKHLTGIQLFAPDNSISFFKDYMFKAAPRFILIDKKGLIIDSFAKRPSDKQLIIELNELL